MTNQPILIDTLKTMKENGRLKDFSPYCIGIVGDEEAFALDCQKGDEYALFHAQHRRALCDWFGEKFDLDLIVQTLLEAVTIMEEARYQMNFAPPSLRLENARKPIHDFLSRIESPSAS